MAKSGPVAPTPSASNGKVGLYTPHTIYNRGDIILPNGGEGWWVCIRPHTSGPVFSLGAYQSDDTWHFSTGPS